MTWIKANRIIIITVIVLLLSFLIREFFKPTISRYITKNENKVWVYVRLKTTLPRDTSDYYYYGQINESIINNIDENKDINGIFILSNIRYWNDADLLAIYEDENDYGYKIFQIKDIHYLSALKSDPIKVFDIDELSEKAKVLRDD